MKEGERTDVTTGQCLTYRSDNVVLNHLADSAQVLLCKRVLVHQRVHRGEDVGGRCWRECPEKRRLHIVPVLASVYFQ